MRKLLSLLCLMLTACFTMNAARIEPPKMNYPLDQNNPFLYKPWVVYYSDQVPQEDFSPFDLIVFDSDFHPPMSDLVAGGKRLLGYLANGTVANYRYYFTDAQNAGVLLFETFPGSNTWYVDVRMQAWEDLLINMIIPNILSQGFTGIFMDSIDTSIFLESLDPVLYAGMKQAAADLINAIRVAFPGIELNQVRGFEIVNDTGLAINDLTGTNVYTTYNWGTNQYQLMPQSDFQWQIGQLQTAAKNFGHLNVYAIDFWDPTDVPMVQSIYSTERTKGMIPYVTTILINQVDYEPPRP